MRAATLIACLLLPGCDAITPHCFFGTPLPVRLEIEPALDAPDTPEFTCSGGIRPGFCYEGGVSSAFIDVEVADLFVIRAEAEGLVGWWPWIGIDLDERRARLCAYHYTDLGEPGGCDPPLCAVEGTIRMSRMPADDNDVQGIAVVLDVTFADGETLSGAFRIP